MSVCTLPVASFVVSAKMYDAASWCVTIVVALCHDSFRFYSGRLQKEKDT